MKEFCKAHTKAAIKEWLIAIDKKEALPKGIVALNFGIYEPYGVELIGSSSYDAGDDDWACEEDFEPQQRDCPDIEIDEEFGWETVLQNIAEILKELVCELDGLRLLQVDHITTGFCDGDLVVIK